MKAITLLLSFLFIFISCERQNPQVSQDGNSIAENYGQSHADVLLKTRYNFSSSTDTVPYSYVTYTYDGNRNLTRELISEYPGPPIALYVYEYSDDGLLLDMKHTAMEGMNSNDQTEDDFTLITEDKYSYADNVKTINTYIRNVLEEIAEYSYTDGLLMSETHSYLTDRVTWSIEYEYDQNNNKIKETSYPDSAYTVYNYDGKTLKSKLQFDKNGALVVELNYNYLNSGDKIIVESDYKGPYGEHTFDKTTYQDGKMTEYILYHPTKPGEWYCARFDYY